MDEHKTQEPLEDQEVEVPEASRREFMTKLVTAAGVVAVAGLVGSAEVSATNHKLPTSAAATHKLPTSAATVKWGKFKNGFRITLTGGDVGTALRQVGAVGENADMSKAKITIEFSA